jgi:hypothetical protein
MSTDRFNNRVILVLLGYYYLASTFATVSLMVYNVDYHVGSTFFAFAIVIATIICNPRVDETTVRTALRTFLFISLQQNSANYTTIAY